MISSATTTTTMQFAQAVVRAVPQAPPILAEEIENIAVFYIENPACAHSVYSDAPVQFVLGSHVHLFIYRQEAAIIDIHIPAHLSTLANRRDPISLIEYLEELEGVVTEDPVLIGESVTRPHLTELFDVPKFIATGSTVDTNGSNQPIRTRLPALERFFSHPHIRQPLAILESPDLVLVAYPVRDSLNDTLAFHPHQLGAFKQQFISFQLQLVAKYFGLHGVSLGPIDFRYVYLDPGWWARIQFPLIASWRRTASSALSPPPPLPLPLSSNLYDDEANPVVGAAPPPPVSPRKAHSHTSIFHKWTLGHMSTFDYLMHLNMLAGRTPFSVHLHPVFPWVTDFTTHLAHDPAGLRDLSKTAYRIKKGEEQLDMTYLSGDPAHHVTTHFTDLSYCTYRARALPMAILRRHVRARFSPAEVPPSLAAMVAWTSDECIPEFYADPTICSHGNGGVGFDPLELPPWAAGDSAEFVARHRALLESPVVSQCIHHWIDLIFGHLLTGPAAVAAKNLALPLAHPDSAFVSPHHGVRQLFTTPHPPRLATATSNPHHPSHSRSPTASLGSPLLVPTGPVISLEAWERTVAFDSAYFGRTAGSTSAIPLSLTHPVHPALSGLYSFTLGIQTRRPGAAAWPSLPLGSEAIEIAVFHARRMMPLTELMDRAWMRMEQPLFDKIFVSMIADAGGISLCEGTGNRGPAIPGPVSVAKAVGCLGPDGFLVHLWPAVSTKLADWNGQSVDIDVAFVIKLCTLIGPAATRSKVFPVLSILLRRNTLGSAPTPPPLLDVLTRLGSAFGLSFTRQVSIPFLIREVINVAHARDTLGRVAAVLVDVIERSPCYTSTTNEPSVMGVVAELVDTAVNRAHVPLLQVALEVTEAVIRQGEPLVAPTLLSTSIAAACQKCATAPPTSPLSTDSLISASYTLLCAMLGHEQVKRTYAWASVAERRSQAAASLTRSSNPGGSNGRNPHGSAPSIAHSFAVLSSSSRTPNPTLTSSGSRSLLPALRSLSLENLWQTAAGGGSSSQTSTPSGSSLFVMDTAAPTSSPRSTTSGGSGRSTTDPSVQSATVERYMRTVWTQETGFKGHKAWSFSAPSGLQAVGYHDASRSIIAGGKDKQVHLWNRDSVPADLGGSAGMHPVATYNLHQAAITDAIGFGQHIASCDGTVHLWDASTAQPVTQIQGDAPLALVAPWTDARVLVGAYGSSGIFMNDVRSRSAPIQYVAGSQFSGSVSAVTVSPVTGLLAAASSTGWISLLDTHLGSLLASWRGHDSGVTNMLFLGGSLITIASNDPSLYIWNTTAMNLTATLKLSGVPDIAHAHAISDEALVVLDSSGNSVTVKVRPGSYQILARQRATHMARPIVSTALIRDVSSSASLFLLAGSGDGQIHGFY
ncbi:hypothetical protein BC828DRAFT_383284 [Blastocladiella britannica]|nr:hypothetical protein BC828DRAFT_383284 [Blastocladiella britannica]